MASDFELPGLPIINIGILQATQINAENKFYFMA